MNAVKNVFLFAVLALSGGRACGALTVDWRDGAFSVRRDDGRVVVSSFEIDTGSSGLENLQAWTVTEGGSISSAKVSLTDEGFRIDPSGLVIIFK